MYKTSIVALDAVGDTIHLNAIVARLSHRYDVEMLTESSKPIFKLAESIDDRVDARSIKLQPVSLRPNLTDPHGVGIASVPESHAATDVASNLRTSAGRRSIELRALHRQFG